jgi:hypothetical protein
MKCQLATSFAFATSNVHLNIFSFLKMLSWDLKHISKFWKQSYRGKNVLEFHDSWRFSRNIFYPIDQKTWKKWWGPLCSSPTEIRIEYLPTFKFKYKRRNEAILFSILIGQAEGDGNDRGRSSDKISKVKYLWLGTPKSLSSLTSLLLASSSALKWNHFWLPSTHSTHKFTNPCVRSQHISWLFHWELGQ